jgi:choline dehydrogenase-like flavoprotein
LARTDSAPIVTDEALSVAVIGAGVVGGRVARQLANDGRNVLVFDRRSNVRRSLAAHPGVTEIVDLSDLDPLTTPVVVVATTADQADLVAAFIDHGHHVVSTSDDVDDVRRLRHFGPRAETRCVSVVIGAAACPGLTGLLARELSLRVDVLDEIHVAFHGTGGPECARQHHRALAGSALGWHDGEWLNRQGGSGRDLLWFPEPIGGKDCYRAALVDPILLHDVFPEVSRISARMSANRRDRLTARLPMLSPPHPEGGLGAVRVEIRGSKGGERVNEVAGVAERTGIIAAAVAATAAEAILRRIAEGTAPVGRILLGDDVLENRSLVDDVIRRGIPVFEYVGAES